MPKATINLVKDQKNDIVERIISWSLSVGRILVIVTELIALIAFLWRFSLDQQLVDLRTQIKNKQAIVSAFQKNENEYRNLQDRLSIISNYSTLGEAKLKVFKKILSYATVGVTLNKVSLNEDNFNTEINVTSVASLSDFVNSVKSDENVASVSVDKIETKTSSAVIVVGLSVSFKPLPNSYAIKTK